MPLGAAMDGTGNFDWNASAERDFPSFFLDVFLLFGMEANHGNMYLKRFMLINQLQTKMKYLSSCLVPKEFG